MRALQRRGIVFLLVLALVASMLPGVLAAEDKTVTISAGTAEGKPGEEVELAISVSENPGISGAGFQLSYDKDALELLEISSARGTEFFMAKVASGKLSWLKGADVTGDFQLAAVRFRIRENAAAGTYSVSLSLIDGMAKNLINSSDECVTPRFEDGGVTVKTDKPNPNPNPSKPAPGTTAKPGKDDNRFSDVPADRWSADYIDYLADRDIIDGIGGGLFGPQQNVTRGQFVKMIAGVAGADVRGMQTAQFKDVKSTDWFAPYVAWACSKGIAKGISADTFAPNAYITREQMAAMIYRFVNTTGETLPQTAAKRTFSDEASFAAYAVDAIYAMQQAEIINGKSGGRFAPKDYTTREEAAKMLALTHQILFG